MCQTLVPLALAGPATQLVLAGDPKQLGPTVRCGLAKAHGLGTSLQERLMSTCPLFGGSAPPRRKPESRGGGGGQGQGQGQGQQGQQGQERTAAAAAAAEEEEEEQEQQEQRELAAMIDMLCAASSSESEDESAPAAATAAAAAAAAAATAERAPAAGPAGRAKATTTVAAASKPLPAEFATKLVCNYRSQAKMLSVPSQLFYESELVAAADPAIVDSLLGWSELGRRGPKGQRRRTAALSAATVAAERAAAAEAAAATGATAAAAGTEELAELPLLFWGVDGVGESEVDSPSFFNVLEASAVVDLILGLLRADEVSVDAADIGVITPFRKQVRLLLARA